MNYSADQVWGLAVRADTVNSGYCKEDVWHRTSPIVEKTANKKLVKAWLIENRQPTDAEIAHGREIRHYFNGFLLREISGQINDFERQALRIAQRDEFTGRDLLEFAVVSCLPNTRRTDQSRQELKREIYFSSQLTGAVGDTVVGDITVVSNRYSREYGRHKITARMGESFVDFWYKEALSGELRIRAKIKDFRSDNTTALNYVKRA